MENALIKIRKIIKKMEKKLEQALLDCQLDLIAKETGDIDVIFTQCLPTGLIYQIFRIIHHHLERNDLEK